MGGGVEERLVLAGRTLSVTPAACQLLRGGQPAENKQNVNSAARMFPQETSAAAYAFGYDSSREKAILENPQIFQNCEIK